MSYFRGEDRKTVTFGNDEVEIKFRKRFGYFEKKELAGVQVGGLEIQGDFKPKFKNPEEVFTQVQTEISILKKLVLGWTKDEFSKENVIEYLGDEDNIEMTEEIIGYLRSQNGMEKNKIEEEKKQDTEA